ncbi:Uncharacterised protein [Klebsiella pneumoniae]|uniref:Uncharacterized protein n=1 Tax=Klebsiella variicola TaxID=244366 RepID=A0A7H4MPA8_KLEVA|nr:Uncharacterised protein [Klebsiella variicola]SXE17808.1 Uncharacterised protein [Klebsiella variicola]SYI60159.1 Uncharacterised protein [Klebsiella pneumoniae]
MLVLISLLVMNLSQTNSMLPERYCQILCSWLNILKISA